MAVGYGAGTCEMCGKSEAVLEFPYIGPGEGQPLRTCEPCADRFERGQRETDELNQTVEYPPFGAVLPFSVN